MMATTTNAVTVSTSIPNIEKLEGQSNYGSWKFAMKMCLMLEGLWNQVSDTLETIDSEKDNRTLAKICLTVKPCCYVHVCNAKNAKEAWNNLQAAYEGKSMSRVFQLTRKLFDIKQHRFASMEEYLTHILSTIQQLADIGEVIEDKWIVFVMLNGVTLEYEALITTITLGKEKLKSDEVKVILLEESARRTIRNESVNDQTTLVTKANGKKKFFKKNIKCYSCGETGHLKSTCPKIKGKVGSFSQKEKEKASTTTTLLTTALTSNSKTDWIIDSGATSHMSHNKEWMLNFSASECVDVAVADSNRITSNGSGFIPKMIFL